MKEKIIFLAFFSLIFFFFVPPVFADDVVVAGKVDNMGSTTVGSKIVFKDSASQQEVVTKEIDPLGAYVVYVPQGTYDISIVPPTQNGLKSITKKNQKITTDTQSNFTLPSPPNTFNSQLQSIPMNMVYAAAGIMLLLILGISYFVWKKNIK